MAAASYSNTRDVVDVLDLTTGEIYYSFSEGDDIITSVEFSPNGASIIAGGYNKKIYVFNASDGQLIHSLDLNDSYPEIFDIAFAPDSKTFVTANNFNDVSAWDYETGELNIIFDFGHYPFASVEVSPDGKWVAVGCLSVYPVFIGDMNTGKLIAKLEGGQDSVQSIKFFPGGNRLVTSAADGSAMIWDLNGLLSSSNVENWDLYDK